MYVYDWDDEREARRVGIRLYENSRHLVEAVYSMC
jgi:hypothetical protein